MEKRPSSGSPKKTGSKNTYKKPAGRKFDGPAGKFSKKKDDGERSGKPFRKSADSGDRPFKKRFDDGDKPRRSFGDDRPAKPFGKKFDSSDRPKRSYGEGKPERSFDKPFKKKFDNEDRPKRTYGEGKPERKFDKPFKKKFENDDRPKRTYGEGKPERSFDKPFKKKFDNDDRPKRSYGEQKPDRKFDKPFGKKFDKDDKPKRSFDSDRPKRNFDDNDKPARSFGAKGTKNAGKPAEKKKFGDDIFKREPKKDVVEKTVSELEGFSKSLDDDMPIRGFIADASKERKPKTGKKKVDTEKTMKKFEEMEEQDELEAGEEGEDTEKVEKTGDLMPLNKYIAHSGECSRRDAAEMVKKGKVKVNGELIMDPGYKVSPDDKVTIAGKKLKLQKDLVYVLLNKPKDFITTTDDPEGRRTVMDLVTGVDERLYPVGRLDRHTTGLILLTNDGDLAQKLSHPSYQMKKVYQVTLDKALTKADFEKIMAGLELEDGPAVVDEMAYLEKKNELGLEIHSGKNRIVRRIFESLGYSVEKLDRVMYAGLTKKNLPRGKWRLLTDREIIHLKHFKS